MKLDFEWKNDGQFHRYCLNCHAETVKRISDGDRTYYFCDTCNQRSERTIDIDPAVKWWIAEDGEYWHESAGVFIRNLEGKFLFFERVMFPFQVTIPAGHVDTGEEPLKSAKRETEEEVGIAADHLTLISKEDIPGDSCRRGCDAHRWHAYLLVLDKPVNVEVKEKDEGKEPVWLTLDGALQKDLTYPVERLIRKFQNTLTTISSPK